MQKKKKKFIGVNKINCRGCDVVYIGQTGWNIK